MKIYNGVKLEGKEADALISIEKRIKKPLKHRNFYPNDMDYFTGFYSENNTVVHLVFQYEDTPKDFPTEILKLENLKILLINEADIKEIPESISSLKYLKHIAFITCRNINKLPEAIGKLKNLEELWFDFCNIEELPNSIGNLKSLRKLHLEDNKLKTLPESIGELENLELLYLYDNDLNYLPDSIGMLKSLKRLVLSSNPNLRELPNSLLNIKSLKHLGVDTKNLSLNSRNIVEQLRDRGVEISLL